MAKVATPYRLITLLCVGLLLSGCSRPQLSLLDENALDWSSLRGQWVVINYWAEWCKPCVEEIPELNHLEQMYPQQVRVLGVNFDNEPESILRQQASRMQIGFSLLQEDPAVLLQLERPKVLPTTYIYSPEGELVASLVGPQSFKGLVSRMGLPAVELANKSSAAQVLP
ncbi:TlpA disulfide reductase family protein [Maricurvus nonylphenolicus]|uniref:TlpA family protein disulfide reductase n=1 Tax=Maricurvus nonylphenolicus TaxID=1008307 RepID=UPI0036F2AAED